VVEDGAKSHVRREAGRGRMSVVGGEEVIVPTGVGLRRWLALQRGRWRLLYFFYSAASGAGAEATRKRGKDRNRYRGRRCGQE
jgi:hypothetical protein